MNWRERLAYNLTTESEAYGYTLTVWGAGAILINAYGTPTIFQILAYIGGGLVAFGMLATIAFSQLLSETDIADEKDLIIISAIHGGATFGNLVISYGFAEFAVRDPIPVVWAFFIVGFQATFTYNVLLLAESSATRMLVQRFRQES